MWRAIPSGGQKCAERTAPNAPRDRSTAPEQERTDYLFSNAPPAFTPPGRTDPSLQGDELCVLRFGAVREFLQDVVVDRLIDGQAHQRFAALLLAANPHVGDVHAAASEDRADR